VKASKSIHFSSISQPPRLTPQLVAVDSVCVGIEEIEDVLVFVVKILTATGDVDVEGGTVGRTEELSVTILRVPIDISEAEFEVVLSTIDTVTVR
jgi:hypothetical protein